MVAYVSQAGLDPRDQVTMSASCIDGAVGQSTVSRAISPFIPHNGS